MKKFKVLGYSNPITVNCVPLITIIEFNNGIGALFPNCTIKKLNIDNKCELGKLKNYVREVNDICIYENEFSYIDFDGFIETDNPKKILEKMKIDLKILENGSDHKYMLEELIVSESSALDCQVYDNIIPEFANDILKSVYENFIEIPIDLYKICKYLEIFISQNNHIKYDGRIFETLDKNIKIEFKSKNNIAKERFTIAHEIGHYVLHFKERNSFVDSEINFSDESFIQYAERLDGEARGNDMEAEASFFAAELLMPDKEVIKFICRKNWEEYVKLTDLTLEMSEYFNVSRNSAILKLCRLNFFEKKDVIQTSNTSNLKINKIVLRRFIS